MFAYKVLLFDTHGNESFLKINFYHPKLPNYIITWLIAQILMNIELTLNCELMNYLAPYIQLLIGTIFTQCVKIKLRAIGDYD